VLVLESWETTLEWVGVGTRVHIHCPAHRHGAKARRRSIPRLVCRPRLERSSGEGHKLGSALRRSRGRMNRDWGGDKGQVEAGNESEAFIGILASA